MWQMKCALKCMTLQLNEKFGQGLAALERQDGAHAIVRCSMRLSNWVGILIHPDRFEEALLQARRLGSKKAEANVLVLSCT